MKIGGHVSIAGGLVKSVERAVAQEFEVMQIFVTSPRSYKITEYSDEDIDAFKEVYARANMHALYFHAVYLLNLGTTNSVLRNLSVQSLIHYLTMGDRLGANGTIVHVGNGNIDLVVESIRDVLQQTPQSQNFIIENMASEKRIGGTIENLDKLQNKLNSPRVKFCIDTQHLFAAGTDIRDAAVVRRWLNDFDNRIGLENIVCIHANDSQTILGSQHDRHENIGQGEIGMQGFETFFEEFQKFQILKNPLSQNPLSQDLSVILETPGFDPKASKGPDRKNKDILCRIIN